MCTVRSLALANYLCNNGFKIQKVIDSDKNSQFKVFLFEDNKSIRKMITKYLSQREIEIYRYAVGYNKLHEGDSFYEDKLKDLEFFEQFPFITEDCLKENPKRKFPVDDDNWGEPNSMEKDFNVEEILDMPTLNDVEINDSG